MTRALTPPHKIQSAAVIIRAMGGNGADDQRAALNELHRRGLWLGPMQAAAALVNAGWRLKSATLAGGDLVFAGHGPWGVMTDQCDSEEDARNASLELMGYCFAPTPLDARPALPVIFRADRSGDFKGAVTAVFPTLPGTSDPWTATCYAHVGQHGTCSRGWYSTTRAATEDESADLLAELRSIYERDDDRDAVRLVIACRWTRHHDDARRADLTRMGRAA